MRRLLVIFPSSEGIFPSSLHRSILPFPRVSLIDVVAVEAAGWAGDVIGNLRPQALTSLMPSNARGQVRISENLRLSPCISPVAPVIPRCTPRTLEALEPTAPPSSTCIRLEKWNDVL